MVDLITEKLILLFVFDKMEIPITEETMLELCTADNDWLNYMDCKELLDKLIDAGFIAGVKTENEDTYLYTITTEGRACIANFFTKIHSSLREEITEYIKLNRIKYRKKQEYRSAYVKNPDGSYTVTLRIQEPAGLVMELKLKVPDRHNAKKIAKNWCEDAPAVYATMYSKLID